MSLKYTLIPLAAVIGIWLAGGTSGDPTLRPADLMVNEPIVAVMSPSLNAALGELHAPKSKNVIIETYQGIIPKQWGEKVSGVAYRLDTEEKAVALTFDLCGGSSASNGYDRDLVEYLEDLQIPATFFVSGRWIDANPALFRHLAGNSLFEIGSHGLRHKPLSVAGKQAYGIKGTEDLTAVIQEVEDNGEKIAVETGVKPHYYRSGTNYYDEVAVAAVRDMGYITVGYNVLGDAGAAFSQAQVKQALLGAGPGSIILLHGNHPEGATAEGVKAALPLLQQEGFRFVKLGDYKLVSY